MMSTSPMLSKIRKVRTIVVASNDEWFPSFVC